MRKGFIGFRYDFIEVIMLGIVNGFKYFYLRDIRSV